MEKLTKAAIAIVIFGLVASCSGPKVHFPDGNLPPEDTPAPVPRKNIFRTLGVHPVCSNIKFASDDFDHYDGVFGDPNYYKAAQRSFIYAWMASNAYEEFDGKKPEYKFREWSQVGAKIKTWRGMGAHVYLSNDADRVVIAYEGTNFSSFRDWLFGNFNVYWKGQYNEAFKLALNVKKRYPNAKLITTGHSLGGGLAIHVALRINGVDAYAFNSSPRVFAPKKRNNPDSRVLLISENKDILRKIRKAWSTLDGFEAYDEYDFLNSDIVTEHSIYYIGRGLVNVAASTGEWRYVDIATALLSDSNGDRRPSEICPT